MSLKQRLHYYFYTKVFHAAGTNAGQKALKLMSPVFARVCPPEKVTQSPEEVLQELGYNPDILKDITSKQVRVFKRDLPSMLSICSMLEDKSLIQRAFSKHMDAVAFFPSTKNSPVRHLLLNNRRNYKEMMANLSKLPVQYITGLKGNDNLAQVMTLGHEMAHFEQDATDDEKPEQMVTIEAKCDFWPAHTLREFADPQEFEDAYNDLMHARAVDPILNYLQDKTDKPKSIFGHATALALDYAELINDPENMGRIIIEANYEACNILMDYIDWESFEEREIQCYRAAKLALEQEEFHNIWAQRVIEMFVNGMDYLAPDLVEQIMSPPKQRNALVLDAA